MTNPNKSDVPSSTEKTSATEAPAVNAIPRQTSKFKRKWLSWLTPIAIAAVVYFGNVELQSYWGREAFAATGLASLPFDAATKKARREGKYVLADLSAVWCPSCRKLDQTVFSDEQVNTMITDRFVFSRIEYESDEGAAFMRKYQVRGFPTVLILDGDGRVMQKMPLIFDPIVYRKHLQRVL